MRLSIRILFVLLLLQATGSSILPAQEKLAAPSAANQAASPQPIPFDQLGAEAQKQLAGEGVSVTPTARGARLRAVMQDLEGEVTEEGLWLSSTADEDAGKPNRFRVRAMEVGRETSEAGSERSEVRGGVLEQVGVVRVMGNGVSFVRPGLIEEYFVSTDGVRQDFVVLQRPGGVGSLVVMLEVSGARAEAASYGAKLIVAATGRELAYSRLKVTDATGRELQARIKVDAADRLRVEVEDAGAVYPVRIDPTFSDADWVSLNSGMPGANGDVLAMVLDGSGNLYIGGSFTFVGTTIATGVAKWNGTTWSAVGNGVTGGFSVRAMVMMGGELYVGGNFSAASAVPGTRGIAKWNGTTWAALGNSFNSSVTISALAVMGTELYVGGTFASVGGESANNVARWNGTSWSALGSGVNNSVNALAALGSAVYAGGTFVTAGGSPANRIAKWDGSAWSALGTGMTPGSSVNALAVNGTNLYAAGSFSGAGGTGVNNIAKWNGTAWSAVGGGVFGTVNTLAVSGATLYAGGNFPAAGAVAANRLAQWNGSAWSPVGSGADNIVHCLLADGSDLYCGGAFTLVGGSVAAKGIAKWNGASWSAFGSGFNGFVNSLAVMESDLYVGGAFTTADGGVAANNIAKWNGSTWASLGAGTNQAVRALAVIGTNLYAGGSFTSAGGVPDTSRIARWNGVSWSALGTGMDGSVQTLAASGSTLYAGGSFSSAGGVVDTSRIAEWDGASWSALGTGTDGNIRALAMSGTNLFAGGEFTTAGGVSANRIAKWDGSAWSALGDGVDGNVNALAVSGTNLFAGGEFTAAGGNSANRIARWDGSAWSALGGGVNNTVNALAVRGPILYVAGSFTTADDILASRIAAWNGSLWWPLGKGASNTVNAMLVSGNDRLYLGGLFERVGSTVVSPYIAQANLSESISEAGLSDLTVGVSSLVPAFSSETTSYAATVTSKTNFVTVTPTVGQGAATVKVNGEWVLSGTSSMSVELSLGNNAVVVEVMSQDGTTTKTYTLNIIRPLISAGDADATFNANITEGIEIGAIAMQPDTKVVFGGSFLSEVAGVERGYARVAPDGTLDNDFGSVPLGETFSTVECLLVQPDGKVIITGNFDSVGGVPRGRMARLNADGTLDTGFNPNVTHSLVDHAPSVRSLALQEDGKILACGHFTHVGGIARNHLVRLHPDGSVDLDFDPQVDGIAVNCLTVQLDGKIVIGGFFFSVNGTVAEGGTARRHVARLLPSGTVDAGFNPNADWGVDNVAVQPDGKVLLGGGFFNVGGVPREGLTRVNADGTLDLSFADVQFDNGLVTSMVLQANGDILIAGHFYWVGGAPRHLVARLKSNGILDPVFSPDVAGEDVHCLALQADGKVYIGGMISGVESLSRKALARVHNDAATQSLSVTSPDRVQWLRGGSAPEASAVTFEFSTDGGNAWTALGAGRRIPGGWEKKGQTLPPSGLIRARARCAGGSYAGSSSLLETVQAYAVSGPEISVGLPAGDGLESGTSMFAFGSAFVGTSIVQNNFVIRNIGTTGLNLSSIVTTGGESGDFMVNTTGTNFNLAPGGVTTVTVTFDPSAGGERGTTLRVASDDLDEGEFAIALTGTGVVQQFLAFDFPADNPVASAFPGATPTTTINVPLRRTGGSSGAVSVRVNSVNGTADGTDFTPLNNVLVTFAEGETTQSVPVTVLSDAGGALDSFEQFTLELSDPQGGALVGTPQDVTITIFPTDMSPPTLTVTAPLQGSQHNISAGGVIEITGTTDDDLPLVGDVKRVQVSLNGEEYVDAVITHESEPPPILAPIRQVFRLNVTPRGGLNTVRVRAIDLADNVSVLVTRTFTVGRTMTVNALPAASGSVTPALAGTAFREMGKSYTVTATPNAGKIFAGWTLVGPSPQSLGIAASALEKPTLTFIFREQLTLTANFVDNPYGSAVIGTYTGLIKADPNLPDRPNAQPDGTPPAIASEGYFTATVQNTGAFSGKLTIDGFVLNVAGIFDHQGRARFGTTRAFTQTVARPNKPSYTVKFDIGGVPGSVAPAGTIIGEVSATEFKKSVQVSVSTLRADRAPFTGLAGAVVPDAYLTVTGVAASPVGRTDGVFTLVLPCVPRLSQPPRIMAVLGDDDIPRGTGVGTLKVTKAGAVTLTATLADGTAVTASGKLSANLRVPLFAQLYGLKGFFSTELQLDGSMPDSDVSPAVDSEVFWNRPFIGASHYYPRGWPETLALDLRGAKYVATANQSVLKAANGVNLADADADGNVTLMFTDGQLEASGLVKSANLSKSDIVTKVPSNDPTFTMVVNRTTGMVTGSFMHTDDTKPGYNAVIFQKGPNAGAYGFFLTKQPVPIDYTGESGGVTVQGQP